MIHIPLSENRIAQFAARFEPYQDGYAYYGDNRQGGLPLSAAERDHYLANFIRILRMANLVMIVWVLSAAVALAVAEEGFHQPTENWQRALLFLLPLPWVLWMWRRSTQIVLDEIGRRMPVTPPRSYASGVVFRVAALPTALPVMMLAIGAVLLVQQWRYDLMFTDGLGDALGAGVIGFGVWILRVKRRVGG